VGVSLQEPKQTLYALDLFSGIGGNSLGLKQFKHFNIRTVAYCEQDGHAQSVLLSRMQTGDLECAPIWDDITTLKKEHFDLRIDLIIAGFNCQDISVAGKREGIKEHTRSGLFFQVVRLANELQPKFIFLENVAAITTCGLDIVCREISESGYDFAWTTLSACDVGAKHRRARWFGFAVRR